jgi:hypothetical protein
MRRPSVGPGGEMTWPMRCGGAGQRSPKSSTSGLILRSGHSTQHQPGQQEQTDSASVTLIEQVILATHPNDTNSTLKGPSAPCEPHKAHDSHHRHVCLTCQCRRSCTLLPPGDLMSDVGQRIGWAQWPCRPINQLDSATANHSPQSAWQCPDL